MTFSNILSNVPYNIKNRSNYGITKVETEDIVDVPYFPAQNLVDTSGTINVYKPIGYPIPFLDSNSLERLFYLHNRNDVRFLFTELADDARYLRYSFIGNSFPQGRDYFSYSFDGTKLYIFGGDANGRCSNDLWEYDINSNSWKNLNFSIATLSANTCPSRRRKSSCIVHGTSIWIFGGETDILTVNSEETRTLLTLNDLWDYDLNSGAWTNYDLDRAFPHRQGNIVHIDSASVKVFIEGGLNTIGQQEPLAIWTLDIATDTVSYEEITAQFEPSYENVVLLIDGVIHIQVGTDLYKWNNSTSLFEVVKQGISCINPNGKNYWVVSDVSKNFGENANMGTMEISQAALYSYGDSLLSTKTMTLPPDSGQSIPRINVDNVQTFFFGGLTDENTFNESTYILNHTTLDVEKYDFDSDERPTERVYTSLAYDKYRGRIWLFGGSDGTKFYNDLWYFDLGLKTWTEVFENQENTDEENPDFPQPRFKTGLAVVATNYLYFLGGYSDVRSFNDFWSYNITTQEWKKLFVVDNIPWGSIYKIFEWRDRLWLFNGQKLYRFFFDRKQFVHSPFLTVKTEKTTNDEKVSTGIIAILESKSYMDIPINCAVVNGKLLVQNSKISFQVDLESKVVTDLNLEFGMSTNVIWLDSYWGIGSDLLSSYYVNVSALQPLTKNQVPNSYYCSQLNRVLPSGLFFYDWGNVYPDSNFIYQDSSGTFTIQNRTDALNKAKLLVNKTVSFCGKQTDFPSFDFGDEEALWNETVDAMIDPRVYPYAPWFLYSGYNVVGKSDTYTGAQRVVFNESLGKIYIIYDNGNTMKLNPEDGTFFTYFTSIWPGSAIGYHKNRNIFYIFGGLREDSEGNATRKTYLQNGMEAAPIVIQGEKNTRTEVSHPGLMQFDMNINEMNLGSVENYLRDKEVASVDYTQTKEHLVSLIEKYIEDASSNILPGGIDEAKQKIYEATQPIIDDMSQFDFAFENGTRPLSRAYAASTQVGNFLYVFGGADSYTDSCIVVQEPEPYHCSKPGSLYNQFVTANNPEAEPVFDEYEEGRRAFSFNMETRTWTELNFTLYWQYLGSAIPSPDERFIYIVGGFKGSDCTQPSSDIMVYDIQTNTYEELSGIPETYAGRAKPLLKWLDDSRLLIMYGFRTVNIPLPSDECSIKRYFHIPITDAWIYDTGKNIMYKSFEDLHSFGALVVKDEYYVDEQSSSVENTSYVLNPVPNKDNDGNTILSAYKWDLTNGEVFSIPIKASSEIVEDYSLSAGASSDPTKDAVESMIGGEAYPETMQELIDYRLKNSNFRFRYSWIEQYGANNHKHMFIIGERIEESGIEAIKTVARGYGEAHLRFWYSDLEVLDAGRVLNNITYEYPIAVSPVALAYDGSTYVYCIYNKYNIWRLNFKKVLTDPNDSWWYQLPPCMDCNFLGDSRTDPIWDTFFIEPNYLALISKTGKMARMDLNTFSWFLDKSEAPKDDTSILLGMVNSRGEEETNIEQIKACSGVDGEFCYLYELGGIAGKVMNVYERQWDNFYFDMRLTSAVAKQFPDMVNQKLWPAVLKRKRIYTMNHVGHLHYSWLRIDGEYDVEFQLEEFTRVDQVRVYGDYNLTNNFSNVEIKIFDISNGWVSISGDDIDVVVNEIDWDWDGISTRRYVRTFTTGTGDTGYQYSKIPPNYVVADLTSIFGAPLPISKVRVYYKNPVRPYNFTSRINKVELLTEQDIIAAYDSPESVTPLDVLYLEPLEVGSEYSNVVGVVIKNNNTDPVTQVIAYLHDNDWLQFTLTPEDDESWGIKTQSSPLAVTNELSSGGQIQFYIRAINIDDKPHTKDLVVRGIYPYEA